MTKLMSRLAAVAAVAWLGGSASAGAAPVLWPDNGHLYEVVFLANVTWDAARADAQLLPGWDLATITSADEQAFIAGLLGTPPPGPGVVEYWVGGFQAPGSTEPGGSWQWINGEGTFWDNGSVGAFATWGGGEPNNAPPFENHLALDNRYGWGWNDNDPFITGFIYGYVRESVAPVPEPGSLALFGLGLSLAALAAARRRSR